MSTLADLLAVPGPSVTITKASGRFESGGVKQEFGLKNAERPREWLHKAWITTIW